VRDKALIQPYTENGLTLYRVLAPYPPNVGICYQKRDIETREEAEEYCKRHGWEVQQ